MSAVGVHVSKQAEIFMYVGPRRCVRAPSRVPPPRALYISVSSWLWHKEYSCPRRHIDMYSYSSASVHVRRSLPGDA